MCNLLALLRESSKKCYPYLNSQTVKKGVAFKNGGLNNLYNKSGTQDIAAKKCVPNNYNDDMARL